MNIAMPHPLRRIRYIWNHTRKRRVAFVILLLFALFNGGVYLVHRDQTYPRTAINGQHIGRVPFSSLERRLDSMKLLPANLRLSHESARINLTPAQLGMRVDSQQTARQLMEGRSWLPVANYFTAHTSSLHVGVDPRAYDAKIQDIGQPYRREAAKAQLVQRDGDFSITPEVNARSIDGPGTQARIIDGLTKGRNEAALLMKQTPPAITAASLKPKLDRLQAQRATAISLSYGSKTRRFTPDEIGRWFEATANSYVLDDARVATAVADAGLELGADISNLAETAAASRQAVEAVKPANLGVNGRPLGKKTYSYCTAGRGVPDSEVQGMTDIIHQTLNAKRGWSLGGNIDFNRSTTQCDFVIWLAAADQMPSFGAICDANWSCAVPPNVIFNYDRWRYTSEPWKKSGGSLADYRAMVVNHEVGHWLGFGHSDCPAAGQSAPVMQQQSIDLQGCVFNPWPSTTERTTLRQFLGL